MFDFLTCLLIAVLGIGTGVALILAYALFVKPKSTLPQWSEFKEYDRS